MVKCELEFVCDGVCGKLLGCEQHTCGLSCHTGECNKCEVIVSQGDF